MRDLMLARGQEGAVSEGLLEFSLVRHNKPMDEILAELSKHPVSTRLSLTGTIVVGRDIVHAKLKERIDNGDGLPQYVKDHPIYFLTVEK